MAEESRVDAHDRNKLDRMLQDLSAETETHDVLHAMFLVTREHEHAHDVFRRFRQVYEDTSSPFHSLTIFGQHGVSRAGQLIAQGLGVPEDRIPSLVLFRSHHDSRASLIGLPASEDGSLESAANGTVEQVIEGGCTASALDNLALGTECGPSEGSIDSLLRSTLDQLTAELEAA